MNITTDKNILLKNGHEIFLSSLINTCRLIEKKLTDEGMVTSVTLCPKENGEKKSDIIVLVTDYNKVKFRHALDTIRYTIVDIEYEVDTSDAETLIYFNIN